MANKIFEQDFSGNLAIKLSNKMRYETLFRFIWGKWAKFNTPKGAGIKVGNGVEPTNVSNSPVVIHYEPQKKPGDRVDVPMLRNLDSLPRLGNQQLEGFEEKAKVNFLHVGLNLQRHANLAMESSMGFQTTKDILPLKRSKPLLERHYMRVLNYLNCSYAMYYGHSYNLLQDRFSSNTTIKSVSHPHIFVKGDGKVSYGSSGYPGTSTYETTVGTALGTLGTTDVFDTAFLDGLAAHADVKKIQPIMMKDGNAFRIIIAHPYQIATLVADTKFRDVANSAFVQQLAKDNPMIAGAKYFYNGFAIFESDTAVFPVTVSGGVPVWGPATISDLSSFESYGSNTMFGAILLGDNALAIAQGSGMRFIRSTKDYGERIGIGYKIVEGVARADFWNEDDGTRGQYLVNQSSAILCTYAAAPSL